MFKKLIFILFSCIFLFALEMNGQETVNFAGNHKFKKVFKNDLVKIKVDTAFVLTKEIANYFNNKVLEVEQIKEMYNAQMDTNKVIRKEIDKLSGLLTDLSEKLAQDSAIINNELTQVIADLDKSLAHLKSTNASLEQTNLVLSNQIKRLVRINRDLKKQTRRIWWDGLTDKIVAFAGGVAVGVIVGIII